MQKDQLLRAKEKKKQKDQYYSSFEKHHADVEYGKYIMLSPNFMYVKNWI